MLNPAYGLSLIVYFNGAAAIAGPAKVHLDERSAARTICHIEFAKVSGLVVDAKPVSAQQQRSRVNLERYSACPYHIQMRFSGAEMRLEFGKSINLENVRNYDPASPIDTGFFVYDGHSWQGTSDVLADAGSVLQVQSEKDYELVKGVLHRQDPNSKAKDYCFAVALIQQSGFVTGGTCSENKSDILVFDALFKKGPVLSPTAR